METGGAKVSVVEGLTKKLDTTSAEIETIDQQMKKLQSDLTALSAARAKLTVTRASLEEQIRDHQKPPVVTDHAVLRYLQRHQGIDVEAIRKRLLSPTVITAMDFGASRVKTSEGNLRIVNRTVVTFTKRNS